MHHFTFWTWIVSRFNRAWLFKDLKILKLSTHVCLAQLDRHQTCKPVMVSVLRHLAANFVQKWQKCQICVIYENLESVHFSSTHFFEFDYNDQCTSCRVPVRTLNKQYTGSRLKRVKGNYIKIYNRWHSNVTREIYWLNGAWNWVPRSYIDTVTADQFCVFDLPWSSSDYSTCPGLQAIIRIALVFKRLSD